MKKVLFMYYFFPPLTGDYRGVGFANNLRNHGWEPVVISAGESVSYGKDYNGMKEVPEKTEIHRVGHHELSARRLSLIKKLKMNLVFPDIFKYWQKPVCAEAEKIINKEKIDIIYASMPPYTAGLTAIRLKKKFNIPCVLEFRDAWSRNNSLNYTYEKNTFSAFKEISAVPYF